MNKLSTAILAAALAIGGSVAVEAQERGGVMTYGRYADSLFLDPVLNDANVDIWILSNMYDTLLLPSADGKSVEPGLATKWEVADDGLSVTLTLRDGAMFSDGTPITTDDVVWSLKRAATPDNGIWGFLISSIADVTAPDDKTVKVTLNRPDPAIIPALTVFNTAIMPKAAFEAAPGATDADKAQAFSQKPVGSGPFVLASWDRGSTMKLVRNEHYWDKGADGKPLPYLDGVTFEVIPDDATRILRLQSGELDGAEFIPYSRVKELQGAEGIDMELFPSTRIEYITLNVRPQIEGEDNPLSNVKVREAMNYATNKDAIIQIVTQGVGTPMTSFMSSATPLNSGTGPLYPYDLEKAKALMKEAGFPDGFSTSMLVLAGSQDELGIATALQQMWSQIGIKLEIKQVDNATRTDQYRVGEVHDADRRLDRRHRRSQRDHLVLRVLADHRVAALGVEKRGGRQALRGVAGRARSGQAGGGIRADPGALSRGRADHPALPDALSGGAAELCEGVQPDPPRQQRLPRDLSGEEVIAGGGQRAPRLRSARKAPLPCR